MPSGRVATYTPLVSLPRITNGYWLWHLNWATAAAATTCYVGTLATCGIVVMMNALFFCWGSKREDSGLAVPAAFYHNYWGMSEAYFQGSISFVIFMLAACNRLSVEIQPYIALGVAFFTPLVALVYCHLPDRFRAAKRVKGIPDPLVSLLAASVFAPTFVFACLRLRTAETSPLRIFVGLWALLIAVSLQLDWPGHTGYYKWFADSGIALAKRRGLGFNGCHPYGIIRVPSLPPSIFNYLSLGLSAAFIMSSWACRAELFVVLFAAFLVYASQLGQESSIGEHHAIPVFAVLLYVAMGLPSGWQWASGMLKLHMISLYLAPGLLKLLTAAIQRRMWWAAPTMQAYVFAALWSRPGTGDALVRGIVRRPWLCSLFASAGLIFELGSPIALLNETCARIFACSALLFHIGVYTAQGISFVSYWCPALLIFIFDPAPVQLATLLPCRNAHAYEWCRWSVAAIHCTIQLACAFAFTEAYSSGPLPFSCMPVFAICTNLFDKKGGCPTALAMIGGSVRCSGHMGPLEWRGPQYNDPWFELSKEDIELLPFPICWMLVGAVGGDANETIGSSISYSLKPKYMEPGAFALFSNFDMPKELGEKMGQVARMLLDGEPSDAYDTKKLNELVDKQYECRRLFDSHVTVLELQPQYRERGASLLQTMSED